MVAAGCGDTNGGSPDAAPGTDSDAMVSSPDAAPVPADIYDFLQTADGMTVEEVESEVEGYRFFLLTFRQPADHDDLDGVWFEQRISLLHRDRAAPTVLETSGYYGSESQYLSELSYIVEGNQLRTEQRFFYPSRPDPADWSLLTIEQAAADHHRIVEALEPYYSSGAWLSTGASKGGMTSVYHRRFYPGDVDGVVAYVAPISFGLEDARYVEFLDQVGDATCRQRLVEFQPLVLERRAAMISRMMGFGISFDVLGYDGALEGAVVELPFAFWQYMDASLCADIPDDSATDDQVFDALDEIAALFYTADFGLQYFQPYYFQAFTELGYPAIDTTDIDDLLLGGEIPASAYLPDGVDAPFDAGAMTDIAAWVATEGSELMFIYGQYDPWTAGAFDLGDAVDSHKYVVAGGNHGSTIEQLSIADQTDALGAISDWANISSASVVPQGAHLGPRAMPRIRVR